MSIKLLEMIYYPSDGSRWQSHETPNPDWLTIESAIKRLDRKEWPFLFLHLVEPIEGSIANALNIMGGRGEYCLVLWQTEVYFHYFDESRSNDLVQIWESDLGFETIEKELCNDLSLVLIIARHFASSGELYSGIRWKKR